MGNVDIVVGGGGIIGLSAALELKGHGFTVKVIERGRFMSEASWAAAGMLAAEDPQHPQELASLARLSRQVYPEYLNKIERLSGHPVPLRTRATLQATRPGMGFQSEVTASATLRSMEGEVAARLVPGLCPQGRSFLWLEEASLDPRDLCLALPAAAAAAGVVLEDKAEVLGVNGSASSVEIATSAGKQSAGAFVNCCGAWASTVTNQLQGAKGAELHGVGSQGVSIHGVSIVEPRKGQMATVRHQGTPKLEYVLRAPDVYLVPRGDGRIAIGATLERVGFDMQVESTAVDRLLALAAGLWAPIASAPVLDRWAGLRPGTSDDLPLIGRAEVPNCWLATGHFRNGILLAPGTAFVMRQLMEGSAPEIPLDAFSPGRLATGQGLLAFDRNPHQKRVS